MVDKDVSKQRELGFLGGDLAVLGSKRGAEALEGGWGVELVDFVCTLLGHELSLQVYTAGKE